MLTSLYIKVYDFLKLISVKEVNAIGFQHGFKFRYRHLSGFLRLNLINLISGCKDTANFKSKFTLFKNVFNKLINRFTIFALETHKQSMEERTLLSAEEIDIILNRLACQLVENHQDFENSVLIGLQPRGSHLAKRLKSLLESKFNINNIDLGFLDTTFFRDDFRRRDQPLEANSTQIDFLVEGKRVVFIDDVLFSGRSVRAGLTAIQSFGRPKSIELLVFIDRRFSRDLPIQPDYKGRQVDVLNNERVTVTWSDYDEKDQVLITID